MQPRALAQALLEKEVIDNVPANIHVKSGKSRPFSFRLLLPSSAFLLSFFFLSSHSLPPLPLASDGDLQLHGYMSWLLSLLLRLGIRSEEVEDRLMQFSPREGSKLYLQLLSAFFVQDATTVLGCVQDTSKQRYSSAKVKDSVDALCKLLQRRSKGQRVKKHTLKRAARSLVRVLFCGSREEEEEHHEQHARGQRHHLLPGGCAGLPAQLCAPRGAAAGV